MNSNDGDKAHLIEGGPWCEINVFLPENERISPENWWLEDEFSFEMVPFQVIFVSFQGGSFQKCRLFWRISFEAYEAHPCPLKFPFQVWDILMSYGSTGGYGSNRVIPKTSDQRYKTYKRDIAGGSVLSWDGLPGGWVSHPFKKYAQSSNCIVSPKV